MIYKKFADTDLKISVLGFGTAGIGLSNYLRPDYNSVAIKKGSLQALEKALELGINFFDTAPAYANKTPNAVWPTDRMAERLLGEVIPTVKRSEIFIATKNMIGKYKPEDVRRSLHESLNVLNTDYIDLFQIHGANYRESGYREMVSEELIEVLLDFKRQGLVRYLGISGYREGGLMPAIDSGIFQAIMPQYNIFYRGAEWELLPLAKKKNIAVMPMRPLTAEEIVKFIKEIDCENTLGINPYFEAMKYVLKNDAVTSIPVGMRTAKEVGENVQMIEQLKGVISGTI